MILAKRNRLIYSTVMKLNAFFYLVATIIILAGLFFVFKSKLSPTTQTQITTQETASGTSSESTPTVFELTIQNKKIISGLDTISTKEGEDVTIRITSDEPEEFHLHGYDQFVDLEKDTLAELSFKANLTGKFPFELEKSSTELGSLEVLPK